MNLTIKLETVTPIFSAGAYKDMPEIRPASIRGQLHHWFRARGGRFDDERSIFGGVSINGGSGDHASPLVVRVSDIQGDVSKFPTLPHKQGGRAAPKDCYSPRTTFKLHLIERLGGLGIHKDELLNALDTWLLLGGFGFRATRGGGSLQRIEAAPQTPGEWTAKVRLLIQGTPMKAALLDQAYPDERAARTVITDTIGGMNNEGNASDSLYKIRYPLGAIRDRKTNKSAPNRKTSPLRLRVYRFGSDFHIAAVWDGRSAVTGNRDSDLDSVIELLKAKNKPIGHLLGNANWI